MRFRIHRRSWLRLRRSKIPGRWIQVLTSATMYSANAPSSLPSVSAAFRVLAVDEKSFPALITISAALDMINHNTVSNLKIADVFTYFYYLSAGFMSCDHIVIILRRRSYLYVRNKYTSGHFRKGSQPSSSGAPVPVPDAAHPLLPACTLAPPGSFIPSIFSGILFSIV